VHSFVILPPCGVVLSMLRGVGMASDRTEVTAVPSVLARLVWRACSCQSRRRGRESLVLGLVFLDQLGLGRSGPYWLMYHGPLGLLTNRCLETPRDHNPDMTFACHFFTYAF
jgi:hypothetical protein